MSEPTPRPADGEGAVHYRGRVQLDYAPERDGDPDPGEIVWTWVPYEEDPLVGKDRPLLVVGRAVDPPGGYAALMLSSRNREGERGWAFLGAGDWDGDGRESWVRTDRVLAVADGRIRRESVALTKDRYLQVLEEIQRAH